jgi:hypothetical protein
MYSRIRGGRKRTPLHFLLLVAISPLFLAVNPRFAEPSGNAQYLPAPHLRVDVGTQHYIVPPKRLEG